VADFPWLTTIGLVPLVGSVIIAALPTGRDELAKRIALAFSGATLVLVIVMAAGFDAGSAELFQYTEVYAWIPAFGVSYAVGVDGIALVLIALTAVLTPVCVLASWYDAELAPSGRPVKTFFALLLVLETLIIGTFAATDVFLFYVFFEAVLIPIYFIIGSYGGPQRSYAAVKFLIYSLLGGLLMLAALVGVGIASPGGEQAFLFENLVGLDLDPTLEKALFLGFFSAFAIKAPLWPMHTWLPDAAAESPPGGAVLLVGVLDKIGTFGMIRLCLPMFPDASRFFTPLVIVACLVGIIYGALVAIGQTDIMRLIAYTSISHFGFITLGIFAMTTQGQAGATLYMVNHGFSTAGLFLVAGFLTSRRGSHLIADYGGVQKVAPVLAGTFLVSGLSSLALPGLSSFVSEFLVLVGTYTRYPVAAVIATVGIVLAAVYILLMYQRMMHGPVKAGNERFADLSAREIAVMGPILAIIVVLGVYPKPVLDVINPAVDATMESIGARDPAPLVPTAGGTQ